MSTETLNFDVIDSALQLVKFTVGLSFAGDATSGQVTAISGQVSGSLGLESIIQLDPSYDMADNIFTASPPYVDPLGISFDTAGGGQFNIYSNNGVVEIDSAGPDQLNSIDVTNISVSAGPPVSQPVHMDILTFDVNVNSFEPVSFTLDLSFAYNGNAGHVTAISGHISGPLGFETINQIDASYEGADNSFSASPPYVDGGGVSFDTTDGDRYNIYSNNGVILVNSVGYYQLNSLAVANISVQEVTCFVQGVRIATAIGETAVEALRPGDLVRTASGAMMPVVWIGRRTVSARFAEPMRCWPIRVKANALAENVPSRDLLVSPDHALLVDDVLIQAGALVNGTSIVRVTRVPETFVYYHVELDDHSLILAENAPAETFVDNVDRMGFDNWAEHEALFPGGKPVAEMPYPRAKARRQVPPRIRAALDERAATIGGEVSAVA